MTELIFDLDGRAVSISISAPADERGARHAAEKGEPDADRPWRLSARWDDEHGSRCGTAVVHHGATLEDFSHRGIARIARRIARGLE